MNWMLLRGAGVLCGLLCVVPLALSSNSLPCEKYAFQLVQQGDSSEMIVETCYDGEWKRICRDSQSAILASVVCKEKLYSSGVLMPGAAYTGQLVVVELECPSSDTPHTRNCSVDVEDDDPCTSGQQVEIHCSNSYLSFLPPGYYPANGSFTGNINTQRIEINSSYVPSIPFYTEKTFSSINVFTNGVILLGIRLQLIFARSFLIDFSVVAPFWIMQNEGKDLRVSVEVFEGSEHNYLSIVSSYISKRTKTSFHGDWLTIVDWDKVKVSNTSSQEMHYQALLVSDHTTTYAIFTYKCSTNLPNDSLALIGTNIPITNKFRYSRLNLTSRLACLNGINQPFYNLFYELTAPTTSLGLSSASAGSCVSAGFNETSCCQPLTDPTEHCRVSSVNGFYCYCDGLCIEREDCCFDIDELAEIRTCIPTCTENSVRLVNQTDLLHGGIYSNLQICASGVWQPVCDDSYDNSDARMICKLMGFADGTVATMPVFMNYYGGITSVVCNNRGSCRYTRAPGDSCFTKQLSIFECTTDEVTSGPITQPPNSSITTSINSIPSSVSTVYHTTILSSSSSSRSMSSGSPTHTQNASLSVTITTSINHTRLVNSTSSPDADHMSLNIGEPIIITVTICMVVLIIAVLVIAAYLVQKKTRNKKIQELEPRVVPHIPQCTLTNDYIQRGRPSLIKPEHIPMVSDKFLILNKQLRLIDPIGQGGFGVVYKAHLFDDGTMTIVAVKTLKGGFDEQLVHEMVEESVRMKTLVHPNVMSLLGVCLDGGPAPYIVLPYMRNGSVLDYLKQNRSSVLLGSKHSDDEVTVVQKKLLTMCLQIAKGMEYLASRKLVHRDLAARNCMIDEFDIIKVADFGLAKDTYEKLYFRQSKGEPVKLPIKWMAIESIEDGVFSEKSDVWSFGITCWEVFNGGRIPYGGITPFNLPCLLQQGHRMDRPFNAACSDDMYNVMMMRCWDADTNRRPSFSLLVRDIDILLSAIAGYLTMGNLISDAIVQRTNKETLL